MLKKLVKDTVIYGSGDFVVKLLAFAVFPIYAHAFTVEQFGIMTLVTTLAGLVSIFANLGLNNSVQRFYWDSNTSLAERPVIVSVGLRVLILWSTIITILVLLGMWPFHNSLESKYGIPWLFLMLALVTNIPAQILQYAQDVLRLHFAPYKFLLVSFISKLSGVLLGLWLILREHMGLAGFFWGSFWALIIALPLGFWLIKRDLTLKLDRDWANELVGYGYPFIFAGLAYWLFGSMDRWMLGIMADNYQVGIYSIAFKFAVIITFINSAFGQAWSPYAIKIYAEEPDYRAIYSTIFSYWYFMLVFLGIGLALFSYEALALLTPKEYWPAATVVGFITMGTVLSGTTQITALGISLEKKTYLLARVSWITAGFNLVLNYILIPLWGAQGAAIATLFSYLLLTGLYLYFTQRLHPIPLEKGKLLFSSLLIVLVLPVAMFFNNMEWHWWLIIYKLILVFIVLLAGTRIGLVPWKALPFIKGRG